MGILVFRDYGMGWDEYAQMIDKGETAYSFITNRDAEKYLKNPDVYQGPAFELLLTASQKAFKITDSRTIYFFRHIVTFIFYWLSGIAFFILLKKSYSDTFIVFIGICWYFLMPRIFADSFYNSKDVPFLAMNIICILFMIKFFEKPSWKSGILHGLFCGFMMDIRLMGILLPAVTCFVLAIKIAGSRDRVQKGKLFLVPFIIFILSTLVFTIAFWPVLWLNPIHHFIKGLKEMSRFTWISTTLYCGEYVQTNKLPWHYDSLWLLITTPLQYIFFFSAGIFLTIKTFFSFDKKRISNLKPEFISILIFFIPLIVIIILHSVEYDAWRHVFFLYGPLCILSIRGMQEIKNLLIPFIKPVFINAGIILITLPIAFKMIEMHPYQNIYFNRLVGPNAGAARFKYELDYWGLANREALEKLFLKTDDKIITVYSPNVNCNLSAGILPVNMREKFKFINHDLANYFISDYRWARHELNDLKRIDSIKVDGAVISSTYILNMEKRKIIHLKASNKMYLGVDQNLSNLIFAKKDEPSINETFTLIRLEGNNYAIVSNEEHFLCSELENKNELTATRTKAGEWETFKLINLDSNFVALKAYNNKYLSMEEKTFQILAKADTIGKNEKFELIEGCFGCKLFPKGYIYSEP